MTKPSQTYVPDDHAGHDRQLVVAFASGDLPAADVPDAQAQVARCRHCAALVDEISRISAAMREDLVAPPRSRDFRLTADDADRLRGGTFTRLLRRLGGPRLQVLQPLAGAAMAVGIVLMATTAVLPAFSGAAGAAPQAQTMVGAPADDAGARDSGTGATGGEVSGGSQGGAPAGALPLPAASAAPLESPDIAGYSETDTSTKLNAEAVTPTAQTLDPVAPVGLGLLILGALLLVVRVVARRASRDPLLR